jgi:hypothetical protein
MATILRPFTTQRAGIRGPTANSQQAKKYKAKMLVLQDEEWG